MRWGFGAGRVHLAPAGGCSIAVDTLFIVDPIVCVGFVFDLSFVM